MAVGLAVVGADGDGDGEERSVEHDVSAKLVHIAIATNSEQVPARPCEMATDCVEAHRDRDVVIELLDAASATPPN